LDDDLLEGTEPLADQKTGAARADFSASDKFEEGMI